MFTGYAFYDRAMAFLDQGGPALVAILMVSWLMWLLILERYWDWYRSYPQRLQQALARWQDGRDLSRNLRKRLREVILTGLEVDAQRHLASIRTCAQVLPLFGLLGTVSGMIETFQVIMIFGNGNARGLAGGISEALLTTMAGLISALPGLYFSSALKQRAQLAVEAAHALIH